MPRNSNAKTDSASRTGAPPDHGTCVVCLDDLDGPLYSVENPGTEGRLVLPCGHAFHGNGCLRPTVVAQAVTGQVTMSGWTREEISAMPELVFRRTAPSCPCCRTPFTAGTYWPDLAEADHLYRQDEGTYRGPNPDYPAPPSPDDDAYPQDDENGQEQGGTHTGPDTAGTGLNDQAHEIWAVVGRAVRDGAPDLPARTYQALQTWPAHNLPHDLWQEILTYLPLEDQTRLAHVDQHVQEVVGRLAPQALDPAAHTTPGFIRTLYTQTELDHSLIPGQWLDFIPGTGSDLTIGQGLAHVHGPGTLTAITGGIVTANNDAHITTVTDGSAYACGQATITTVTGGSVRASDQATIGTMSGGDVTADGQATITNVTGGNVRTYAHTTIEEVTGGSVEAHEQTTITTVTGGTVYASGETTITTVTDGTLYARDDAAITAITDGYVTAHDQATIEEVTGGTVHALDDATITTVTDGTLYARDDAAITTVTGGTAHAEGQTTITSAIGGTITATDNAAITARGDAHIVARGNAQVFIEAGADGVHVDAYDAAHITAHSGTITIYSPDVTITSSSDGNAVISHA
ncbi:hypothetical protein [Streptomyces sp. NPDC057910]|uniref:hypothetical protein n=1 Tax=Streptomyces sp. NPDC057910 TaxID=3346278 RepID=UPI0036EDBE19